MCRSYPLLEVAVITIFSWESEVFYKCIWNAGFFINSDQSSCIICIEGQYQDLRNQPSCNDDCTAGSYIAYDRTTCLNCPTGQYQDQNDQKSCKDDCSEMFPDVGSYITSDNSACKQSPTCSDIEGLLPNNPTDDQNTTTCVCGTTICSESTGLFCTSKLNLCTVGANQCASSAQVFDFNKCEVVTDRCKCSKCVPGWHTANCIKCTC